MLSAPDFRDKQIVFAMLSHGDKLSFKNDNLIIKDDEGIKHQSTCYRLFALFIVGHATITTGLLQRAKKFGFSIFLLTHSLSPYGNWLAKTEGNVLLRKKQYEYKGLKIAKLLVRNKISQQINFLKKRRKKSEELQQTIHLLSEYSDRVDDIGDDLQTLLGIEGIASRIYFKQMFDNVDWSGRKPRTKHDITNLLLDIGYTQLFNLMDSLLNIYGFDVYQGVYHQVFYQRKSLVCDLVEPFRPIIDYRLRKAQQLGQINLNDFDYYRNQYRLFGKSSQPYTRLFLETLIENKEKMFDYVQTYYRAFLRDKPIEEYPIFSG